MFQLCSDQCRKGSGTSCPNADASLSAATKFSVTKAVKVLGFPGDDARCDAGGCQKVVLTKRQALAVPAGRIHMVDTHSDSMALGVKCIDRGHLLTTARVFLLERKDEELFSSCHPAFPMLALNELMVHLWLVSKIKLLYFVEIKKIEKKTIL